MPVSHSDQHVSPWSPLRQPVFRALWLTSLCSDIGTWMQNVGAAWLMTSLAPSPLMVALLQTATSLPSLLLALPAGAVADVVDRRKLLIAAQAWMVLAVTTLGVLTLMGAMTSWWLLALTFAIGIGSVFHAPAWQATTPELVPRSELAAAVALAGVGFNVARAIGPALGGVVVALSGPWLVFLLNAASFLVVMIVLLRWRRPTVQHTAPAEQFSGALRAGVRYMRHAPLPQAVLVRAALFVSCGTAIWALLPILARRSLGLDSAGYGLLLGCFGVGSLLGTILMSKIKRRLSPDAIMVLATAFFAAVMAALAVVRHLPLLWLVMAVAGIAWIILISTLNVAAQLTSPSWVQGRALAVYLLVFQGGMAIGSLVWGLVAERFGLTAALLAASCAMLAGLLGTPLFRLGRPEDLDLTPAHHWPVPHLIMEPRGDGRQVLVTIDYRIDPARANEFANAMQALRTIRLRDGAVRWQLTRDDIDPGRYREQFLVESWPEHVRQHERVTVSDRAVQERIRAFHLPSTPPIVSHAVDR